MDSRNIWVVKFKILGKKIIYLIFLKNGNEYLWVLLCVCLLDIILIVDLKESKI